MFDLHTHTDYSDGRLTMQENIKRATELGLSLLAITDHFGEPLHHRMSVKKALQQKEQLEKLGSLPLKVLFGLEVGMHTLVPERLAQEAAIIIRSVHYSPGEIAQATRLFDEKYWDGYKEKVLEALEAPADVLGHVEGYLPLPVDRKTTDFADRRIIEKEVADRFFDAAFQEEVARKAAQNGIAIELHSGSQTPRPEFIARCLEAGCLFSIGSDAHRVDAIGNVQWGFDMVKQFDIPKSRLLPYEKGWLVDK